ncbi:quinone-dependent dihydroorotate dehydrogenase [Taibaiella lutea]|uniref:Dihydroorotate dehydrogenase (quinone) n=1 Tax=Taibaiella lutea TaxID=2608001 RepID=A0A5M6CNA5_9BACT|nr:quinone-dependent dihydroorotate dehydrogenase [Taibaiella lutea]KAA5536614.1 quinone-dependent dihydroorotate dehydrogenase [Taibaiella lutea]
MYSLIKFFLFKKDPEVVHYWVMNQLKKWSANPIVKSILKKNFAVENPQLERKLWGLTFKNPVGLAAGFDKDAKFTDELAGLGFGFIEIGTLTPVAQDGNDKPRLFRLPKDKALINRMGFNNGGVKAAAERLRHRKSDIIIGGNIGKNKITENENATGDYEICFRELYDVVDYFTVNVSSPNTPNLRALQEKEPLEKLLGRLQIINSELGKSKPILLKIAPDLTLEQLDDIIDIVNTTKIQGVVATNTTISRAGLTTNHAEVDAMGAGGVSGLPVKEKATDVIRYIHQKSKGTIPIIAAGGIFTAADAKEKLDAGASLVQVYTGFIYEGPRIVKNICEGL